MFQKQKQQSLEKPITWQETYQNPLKQPIENHKLGLAACVYVEA